MRITRVLSVTACFLAICLAGCGGQAGLLPTNPTESSVSPWEGYDPFAPEIEITPTKSVLATAKGISENEFNVVALDQLNQVDQSVQDALLLAATSKSLVISLQHPVPYTGLYISYDQTRMHATMFVTDRPDGISLAVEIEPGLIAVGVCAFGDNQLNVAYPLVSISFEDGASLIQKRISAISPESSLAVRNLEAVDGGEEAATLGWSERNTGDYDLNGEVNVADITPIAINYGEIFTPASANYAQLEVVDGDENLEINLADLTPIAINYASTIVGYNVYRMPLADVADDPSPDDPGWELLPNASDPNEPTIKRVFVLGQNFRLGYTYLDATGDGAFAWYVVPVGKEGATLNEGKPSNVSKVVVTGGTPPDAGISFVIMPPNTSFLSLNDEFYIGIQVADIEGLFSANIRFEYDGSLIEFMEGVPTYDANLNMLDPPLFITADDVGTAVSPFILLGFNATQTQGTATKDGTGFIGYFKFKVIDARTNTEALRFPVGSNFMRLWGAQYGVPIATPALGSAQTINAG